MPTTTLRNELELLNSLLELMKQERQCLISADSDGLAAITPRKSTLVQQMSVLAGQRHRALGAAGCAARDAGMEDWLAGAADEAARAVWRELLERTREGKELNRVNGMLINKQMMNTQVLLNAMRTPAGGADSGVYGPGGQITVGGPSRRHVIG
ncbi:MAG: flagellar protein FlgN [Massilia sp.]|nr:flagellar protein FlgN [Massilia sp.]